MGAPEDPAAAHQAISEVDNQPNLETGRLEVGQGHGQVRLMDRIDGFDLDYDFPIDDEV